MKTLFILLAAVVTQVLVTTSVRAALSSNQLVQLQIDVTNGVPAFRQLFTPSNFQVMGFDSSNEVLTATAGEPIQIYTVGLSGLTNFQAGNNLSVLLQPVVQAQAEPWVIVPLLAGTNIRSSVTLRFQRGPVLVAGTPGRWNVVHWGQPKLIRNLVAAYRAIPNAEKSPSSIPYAVELEGTSVWLVSYNNLQNQVVLRTTVELSVGPILINRHQAVTPATILGLAAAAKQYNGRAN